MATELVKAITDNLNKMYQVKAKPSEQKNYQILIYTSEKHILQQYQKNLSFFVSGVADNKEDLKTEMYRIISKIEKYKLKRLYASESQNLEDANYSINRFGR